MKELDALIHFWKEFLLHNRAFLEPSLIYQLEQTFKYLTQLYNLWAGTE